MCELRPEPTLVSSGQSLQHDTTLKPSPFPWIRFSSQPRNKQIFQVLLVCSYIKMRPGSGSVVGLWLFFSKNSFLKPVFGSYWNPHIKDKQYLLPSYVRTQSWPICSRVADACGARDQAKRLRCIAPCWPTLDRQRHELSGFTLKFNVIIPCCVS